MQDLYERILERITPLEVYGEFVQLRRSGKSYVGLCPFHAEDTPSFHVDPHRGLFHCFGCGAGGNLVTFVAEIQRISRQEALRWLAQRAGIPPEEIEDRRPAARLSTLLQMASEFYHRALLERPELLAYIESRGISMATITRFQLGFAPPEDTLREHLLARGFSRRDLLLSGLFVEREGELVERMAGRIVFPIRSPAGRVVAMGGRVVDKTASPKYINFENTPIFEKQRVLYGFWEGRRAVEERELALVVEGYMDVLAMHEAGLGGAVAPLGTFLSPLQAALLKRVAGRVRLVFDGDAAGRAAARRSAEVLLRSGVEVEVVLLPEGKDPADLLVGGGPRALQEAVSATVPFWRFYTDGDFSLPGVRKALGVLREVKSPVLQEIMLSRLAAESGLGVEVLRREMRQSPVSRRESPRLERFLPYRVAALACVDPSGTFRKTFMEVFARVRPWMAHDERMEALWRLLEGASVEEPGVEALLARARFEEIPEDEEAQWGLLVRALREYVRFLFRQTRDERLLELYQTMVREDIHGRDEEG